MQKANKESKSQSKMNMKKTIENTMMYQMLFLSCKTNIFWTEVFKAFHIRSIAITFAKAARCDAYELRQLRKEMYQLTGIK